MPIDEGKLELAKDGMEKPSEAVGAAEAILAEAWDRTFNRDDAFFLRHLMDALAERLMEVAALPQGTVYYNLVQAVQNRKDPDSMQELFRHAWDAAHDPYDAERWTRLMFLIGVLFLMADYRSTDSGTTLSR